MVERGGGGKEKSGRGGNKGPKFEMLGMVRIGKIFFGW